MKNIFLLLVIHLALGLFAASAQASQGDWYFDPHVTVGFNEAQGTFFSLGADLGMYFTDEITGGIGGYYAAGERPSHDREIGGGPFIGYVYPVASFLLLRLREQIYYVDLFDPIETVQPDGSSDWSHTRETGVASATTAGFNIFFTPNFVLCAGYRLVVGLTNDKLDDGRSGVYLGLALGI